MIFFGWLLFGGGYTLVYYGVSMWKYYAQANVPKKGAPGIEGYNPDGIPITVLLGLSKPIPLTNGPSQPVHSSPPFNLGGTIFGATPHTVALSTQTGGSSGINQPGTVIA